MNNHTVPAQNQYTCKDYREEMILLSLTRRLQDPGLLEEERTEILQEIIKVEKLLGLV